MQRISITPRMDWEQQVADLGFDFYKTEGIPYWDESAYYMFDAAQIDVIEEASNQLHDMFIEAIQHVIVRRLFPLMGINAETAALITASWERRDPSIYGRFDLMYDGAGPPKLLEYNADTPTSLFESSIVQWQWQQSRFSHHDQFNSIHEALVERWRSLRVGQRAPYNLHVTCTTPMPEDEATVGYMGATAIEAGWEVKFIPIQDIGFDNRVGIFSDMENQHIKNLYKLYPWEWLLSEDFGAKIGLTGVRMHEPAWKMLMANKHMLSVLWELFPGHENLLPTYDSPEALVGAPYVRKPALGREGANITLYGWFDHIDGETDGPYGTGDFIYQEYVEAPVFDGKFRPNIGTWMVNGTCHGMGIREDDGLIIGNTSRFVPHIFL